MKYDSSGQLLSRSVERLRTTSGKRADRVTRVISFTGGKGGTGKTSTVVNVAIALARMGRSVLLLDADLGLANIDVLLGLTPRHTLHDVVAGRRGIDEIMLDGPEGISLIPAASGVESICTLNPYQRLALMEAIEDVAIDYDYLLIDTQAGIGSEVMNFNHASSEIVCVINSEPTSLTDAYALIKVLSKRYAEKGISVIANNVPDERIGYQAFKRLSRSVERFLHIALKYVGFVPTDPLVAQAVHSQRAMLELYPSSQASRALTGIAKRIEAEFDDYKVKGGLQFFFRQLIDLDAHGSQEG